ncbi:MAG: hypothetical protein QXD72_03115, partial [Candidatus Aenigmatarchaeota archaeon]
LKNYKTFAGIECRNAEEIGDAIEQESSYYKVYLKNKKNADLYLYLEARGYEDIANAFRKYAQAFNQERAFNTIVLELQGKEKFKFGNLIFFKPEDLLATEGEVKDKLIEELTNPDSKLSIWLEQFTELKGQIDKWRKLGRYESVTLSYTLEKGSPFHFFTELAHSVKEFKLLFGKYIKDKSYLEKMTTPDDVFIKEADFWLVNYQNTSYLVVLEDYLKGNVPNLDKNVFSSLFNYLIQMNKFNVNYYWDNLKPLIEKGELQCEEDILKKAEGLLENHKIKLRDDYSNKQKKLQNLLQKAEQEMRDIRKPAEYSFYKIYKKTKDLFSKAESTLPVDLPQESKKAISLLESSINDIENIILPEIDRIKRELARKDLERKTKEEVSSKKYTLRWAIALTIFSCIYLFSTIRLNTIDTILSIVGFCCFGLIVWGWSHFEDKKERWEKLAWPIIFEIIFTIRFFLSHPAFVLVLWGIPCSRTISKPILSRYPKKYISFIIPSLVFAGLFLIAVVLPNDTTKRYMNYKQGNLIFEETFDDNQNNWPILKGTSYIKNGKYYIKGTKTSSYIYFKKNFPGDFVVECNLRRQIAPDREKFFGLLFGDVAFPDPVSYASLLDYYKVKGEAKRISDLKIYKEFLSKTEPLRVKAFCMYRKLRIYLHGTKYSEEVIKEAPERQIGFYVSADGGEIEIDDIRVYSLVKEWWKF